MADIVKKKKKKKKSQAPVALVYFATLVIFLAIFSVVGVKIMEKIDAWKNPPAEEIVSLAPTYTTMYARVNSKGVLSDLFVIRISPEKEQIIITPMSAYTVSSDSSKTFREVYDDGGVRKLKKAVEETFGISTDYYVTLSNTSFERVADIMGGIAYSPKEDLYYLSKNNDNNDVSYQAGRAYSVDGRQIRLLCQYPVFAQGKGGNTQFLGEALFELINGTFQQVSITKNNMDNMFGILTENSDTNLTKNDYKEHKIYLLQMLGSNLKPAVNLTPEGTWTDDSHFTVSETFKTEIAKIYAQTEPEAADVPTYDDDTNSENTTSEEAKAAE